MKLVKLMTLLFFFIGASSNALSDQETVSNKPKLAGILTEAKETLAIWQACGSVAEENRRDRENSANPRVAAMAIAMRGRLQGVEELKSSIKYWESIDPDSAEFTREAFYTVSSSNPEIAAQEMAGYRAKAIEKVVPFNEYMRLFRAKYRLPGDAVGIFAKNCVAEYLTFRNSLNPWTFRKRHKPADLWV